MVGPAPPPPSGATQTATGDISTLPGDIPTSGFAGQISNGALSGFLTVFGWLSA
jgi:hypothetical protein